MKQPITVTVDREHGNSGDVITTIRDARGEETKLAVPGDCTPYHALATLRAFLEAQLNAWKEPVDGFPFCVVDREQNEASVLVGSVEIGRVKLPPPPKPEHTDPTPATPEQLAGQPPKEPAS
jgi:hypothetical protein